jgi:hypothetical protein
MPSERTFVTELATAIGLSGQGGLKAVLEDRPLVFSNLGATHWDDLVSIERSGRYPEEFGLGFSNGRAFFEAPAGLNCRRPRLIEWTGGRRPPGDEVVPADLRVDHVYLVSCKYASRILHNPSPARLVEGLLSTAPVADSSDWFARTAPEQYQGLYELCAKDLPGLPMFALSLGPLERRRLAAGLKEGWPEGGAEAYGELCWAVARQTAKLWRAEVQRANPETVLWRLLRIGAVPYFVLGSIRNEPVRLRIDTPWDWRQKYRLVDLSIAAQEGGQSRVGWDACCEVIADGSFVTVSGHVEIRWSHGRFAQPPEAKVYLDSPHHLVPGYNPL